MSEVIDVQVSPSDPATKPRAAVRAAPAPLTRFERTTVACLSLTHSMVFAWAYVLPWDKFTPFCMLSVSLSASHALLCVAALVPALGRFQLALWRLTSSLGALTFAWGTWAVFSSAWYLSRLYAGLGQGLSAALVAIWALLMLVTVPSAVWGFARTRGTSFRLPVKTTLGGVVVALLLGSTAQPAAESGLDAAAAEWSALVETQVAPLVKELPRIPPEDITWSSSATKRAVSCELPALDSPTAFVFFRDRKAQLVGRCYQAPTVGELAQRLASILQEQATSELILVDRVTRTREIREQSPLLDPLMLRPGVDGACIERKCFAPWQLLAQGSFIAHAPLAFLADLKFGLSLENLRKQLSRKSGESGKLLGIETQSVSITSDGVVTPLRRHHPIRVELDAETVALASTRYAEHILAAQQANGQFRYTLDPFSGKAELHNFSIPRQAGTLLVLCELGKQTPEVESTIRQGLSLLLDYRRTRGDRWALSLDKKSKLVRLGDSALPLVAFTTCRQRVGPEFDDAIRGLSQFILTQQQPDGSFTSTYDWNKQRHLGGPEALYGPGQALLGLTLLDSLVLSEAGASPTLGNHDVLTAAIQRGMDHVAHVHWDTAMYPFFFIEENWNCLTARAALAHQRNDAYEQFCIDYMRFKSRLIFDERSDVAPEFLGGFGFGNVIPPHNTGAAGFGEAMAALLRVKQARGEDTAQDEALLELVLKFLLRQQWTPDMCFGCAPDVVGSMSEHMHSPITRIDFTQHAWAAVGHGARALGIGAL